MRAFVITVAIFAIIATVSIFSQLGGWGIIYVVYFGVPLAGVSILLMATKAKVRDVNLKDGRSAGDWVGLGSLLYIGTNLLGTKHPSDSGDLLPMLTGLAGLTVLASFVAVLRRHKWSLWLLLLAAAVLLVSSYNEAITRFDWARGGEIFSTVSVSSFPFFTVLAFYVYLRKTRPSVYLSLDAQGDNKRWDAMTLLFFLVLAMPLLLLVHYRVNHLRSPLNEDVLPPVTGLECVPKFVSELPGEFRTYRFEVWIERAKQKQIRLENTKDCALELRKRCDGTLYKSVVHSYGPNMSFEVPGRSIAIATPSCDYAEEFAGKFVWDQDSQHPDGNPGERFSERDHIHLMNLDPLSYAFRFFDSVSGEDINQAHQPDALQKYGFRMKGFYIEEAKKP